MPLLIISDIHSNLEALEAVLEDALGLYSKIVCLGDIVGYGGDPNPVTDWVRENIVSNDCVRGNHDRACTGNDSLEYFNPAARHSAIWTNEVLTDANRVYLESLPRGPLRVEQNGCPGFDMVHGSPTDEDEYLVSVADAKTQREALGVQLTWFGHTHVQGGFLLTPGGVRKITPSMAFVLEPDYHYLINPGSVGQPRDRDPRAAYALYSPEDRVISFRRVKYDIEGAANKIRAAGLPEPLATRLSQGV